MSRSLEIVTIKPQTRQVEYQIRAGGQVTRHGDVLTMETMGEDTTAAQIRAAAEADAEARGLLPTKK